MSKNINDNISNVCSVNISNSSSVALTTKQIAREMLFSSCLIEHIRLLQIKMTYTKKTLE